MIDKEPPAVSSHHLQQQELVAYLYHRFRFGIYITLSVALLASLLAYVELAIQGREHWVLAWYASLCVILLLRWRGLQRFLALGNRHYFPYRLWHRRFFIGVVITGLALGCGAALLMPYITINMQIVMHAMLLTMCAGAIAYLSTSFPVYICYMLTMMFPVTVWLFLQHNTASYVLSCLYVFFMVAGWISVRHMNRLVNDALYYRYDNESLIEDLQRLLQSVSRTNKALEKISTTDELSGISNYRAFRVRLEDVWSEYRGNGAPVSLIKLNLDYYHDFNTRYGEQSGDRYLRELAALVSAQISHRSQLAARLQGAEFALLLPGISCENARRAATEIVAELESKNIEHDKSPAGRLTLSVGIGCQAVGPDSSSRELLVRTDTALKLARERGGHRIEVLEA
ncbi:MAG: GGDEF domain-containing protein [Gammaproteobacteria bacterium]|jgi:diguanylate cyclase (GGDEF)-like protein